MSYSESLHSCMNEYEQKVESYNAIVNSDRYNELRATAAFEFILGLHICELLDCFNNNNSAKMKYSSAQDAAAIYSRIVEFRNKKDEILDAADEVMKVKTLADEINELVSTNAYLPKTLLIEYDKNLCDLAEECLKHVPDYDKLLSKKFRNKFTESCIESLPNEELDQLVATKYIQAKNLDMISPTGSITYEKRLRHVCTLLGRESIVIAEYDHKLRGVSFDNEDGVNRQEILAKMHEAVTNGENIKLEVERYEYTPEGSPSEPAIRVLWNGQAIGNLSRTVVQDILGKTDAPITVTANFVQLTGGGSVSYGCNVNVNVYAIVKESEIEQMR